MTWPSFLCHVISSPFDTEALKFDQVWDPEVWTKIHEDAAPVSSYFNKPYIMDRWVGNPDFVRFAFVYAYLARDSVFGLITLNSYLNILTNYQYSNMFVNNLDIFRM